MVFVTYASLPSPEPTGNPQSIVVHSANSNVIYAAVPVPIPDELKTDDEAICDLSLVPLHEIETCGAIVWADKVNNQWRYVCIDDTSKQNTIHVFDFDLIKGFVQSEKEYTQCPMCKKGSTMQKEAVSQIEVSFIEDLMAEREDFVRQNDIGMVLFYEQKIAMEVIKNEEMEHKESVLGFIRSWNLQTGDSTDEPFIGTLLKMTIQKDREQFFTPIIDSCQELQSECHLQFFLEEACQHEASGVIESLVSHSFKPVVTKACFHSLIDHMNEYLIDLVLDYYASWSSEHTDPNKLLGAADWLELGVFSIVRKRFPSFVRSVQQKGVYRLHSQMKSSNAVSSDLLLELGLQLPEEMAFDYNNQSDEWDDEWDGNDDWDE